MTTINGRACVVNGKAVDKVFSNGKQVYGRNLLKGSRGPFIPNSSPIDYDNILYTDLSIYLEEGTTYTISASSNGNFTSDHDSNTESDNIVLWLTNVILDNNDPKFSTIISSQTTGTTGTTFTWSRPSIYAAIRVNAYHKNPIMHVEKMKLEKGSVATPWTLAPEDVLKGYIAAPRNLTATVIDVGTEKLDWE